MEVPEKVKQFCNRHPMCKGCPLPLCDSAPVAQEAFDHWLERMIQKVELHIEGEGA
ncbi:MAG: hypothetical protein LAT65_05695 [Saccharospirillum sp.]|nr:hypothetical protein [Saccharospirillum sp.]